jgi:hypothetical protein
MLACCLATVALPGCDLAPPDRSNEAQQKVDDAAAKPAAQANELNRAIQTPIDKAKAANEPNVKHDQDQDKALQDAGG